MTHTTLCFSRLVAATHVVAFASLFVQLPGLFGEHGIAPFRLQLERARAQVGDARFSSLPTLLWLQPHAGLSLDELAGGLCLIGCAVAASLATAQRLPRLLCAGALCLLHLLSLSLFVVGSPFLSFQWDILLLEATAAAVVCCLLPEALASWLVRTVLFKLMLMSGVVKIQSRCKTWTELTALTYHWATQPLPTPGAWFANALVPDGVRRLSVACTLVLEGPLAFLLLSPLPSLRFWAAALQIFFQVNIAVSGNYTFFNALTAILAIGCLPTVYVRRWSEKSLSVFLLVSTMLLGSAMFTRPASAQGLDFTQLRFALSADAVTAMLGRILPPTMHLLFFALPAEALRLIFSAPRSLSRSAAILVSLAVAVCYVSLLCAPLDSLLSNRDRDAFYASLPVRAAHAPRLHQAAGALHLSSGYGLFRMMTGVGDDGRVARPELVIYGRTDQSGEWKEIPFVHKPGADPALPPTWVAPHQPRLDWQMWFAALAPNLAQSGAPWIITTVAKLLSGSQPVWNLLSSKGPFSSAAPPTEIKIMRHESAFSVSGPDWWVHDKRSVAEWMQPVQLHHIPQQYLAITTPSEPGRFPWAAGGSIWPAAAASLTAAALAALLSRTRSRAAKSRRNEHLKRD